LIFFIILKDYRKRLKQSTSNTDYVNLNWLNLLLVIWSISVFILIPFHAITVGTPFLSTDLIEVLVQIANLVFIFIFGWYGLKQNIIYQFEQPLATSGESYLRSGLTNEVALQLKDQLLAHMQNEKPYLNNELKAHEMAQQLGISTAHLSQVLNKYIEKSFFEFVNEYRVKEVIQKMKSKEHQHYTLLAIALYSALSWPR
jgi:AraC-like DNA-binding protein